jgi:histidinol-phosphate phosphatase family protein
MMNRAIFLDRDGVINVDKHYCNRVEELQLTEGLLEGLKLLQSFRFCLIVVSNQSGIARGHHQLSDVLLFHQAINGRLFSEGAPTIDLFLFCPHLPSGKVPEYAIPCLCRKPSSGMIDLAAHHLSLDLDHSWLIGDRWSDIEAGSKRGLRSIQIESLTHPDIHEKAFAMTSNFFKAAQVIATCEKSARAPS